jgi:hypothetical protein
MSLLVLSTLLFTAISQNAISDPGNSSGTSQGSIIWQTIGGMTGEITTEIKLVDQTNAGLPDTVLELTVVQWPSTFFPVRCIRGTPH